MHVSSMYLCTISIIHRKRYIYIRERESIYICVCVINIYIYIYTDTGYILPGSMTQRQHSCGASAALAFSSSSSDSSGSLATGWSHSTRHNFPGQNAPILGQLSVIRAFDQLGENCKMSYSICHARRPYQSATRRLSMMSSQISKKKNVCVCWVAVHSSSFPWSVAIFAMKWV